MTTSRDKSKILLHLRDYLHALFPIVIAQKLVELVCVNLVRAQPVVTVGRTDWLEQVSGE